MVNSEAEIRINLPGKPSIVITGFTKAEVDEILPKLQSELMNHLHKKEEMLDHKPV